jgi:hypothetical protein
VSLEVPKESVIWKPRIKALLFSETALSFVLPVQSFAFGAESGNCKH